MQTWIYVIELFTNTFIFNLHIWLSFMPFVQSLSIILLVTSCQLNIVLEVPR